MLTDCSVFPPSRWALNVILSNHQSHTVSRVTSSIIDAFQELMKTEDDLYFALGIRRVYVCVCS